jgi:PAS domain S-box-containing protein
MCAESTPQPGIDELHARCAEEPIRFPGNIQPYAALLAGRRGHPEVIYASANLADILGVTPTVALGMAVQDLIPGLDSETHSHSGLGLSRTLIFSPPGKPEIELAASSHQQSENWCVQIESCGQRDSDNLAPVITPSDLLRLSRSTAIEMLLGTAVTLFRSMLGYHRVMIYKFHQDWHGEVVAESRQGNRVRYLGLHYPATDIPSQARDLYLSDRIRLIPDVDFSPVPILVPAGGTPAETLNLTGCSARAVSPAHLQYLRNMDVRATLVISLVVDGKLWGLVACHHDTPRWIPPLHRDTALSLAEMVCVHIDAITSRQHSLQQATLRNHVLHAGLQLTGHHTASETFSSLAATILAPITANGAALLGPHYADVMGECPSQENCLLLFSWLQTRHGDKSGVALSDAPRQLDFPWPNTASGILAASLGQNPGNWLVFFRPEWLRELRWGGNPHDTVSLGGDGRLNPRASFAAFTEIKRGCSHPWTEPEVDYAHNLALTLRNGQLVHERIRAETKFRYSEQRRVAMLAAMPDVLFVLDKDGIHLDAHIPAGATAALPKAELLGKSIRTILPAGVANEFFQSIALLQSGAKPEVKIHYALALPGTGPRHYETRMVPSAPGQFLCIARDITRRHLAQQSLEEERTILRTIFDDAFAGYWDIDLALGIAFYSPAYKAMLGYDDDEFPNHPDAWKTFAFPEDVAKANLSFARHVASRGQTPFNERIRFRHKDGSTRYLLNSGRVISWGPDGEPLRVVGCKIDVTPLVETQEDNSRLALVTQHTGDAVLFTDTERRITWANDSFTRITGYTSAEVIGRTPVFLQGPGSDPATLAAIHTALDTKQRYQGDILNYAKDGTPYWNQLDIVPHFSPEGKHIGFISVQADITEKKQAADLVERERSLFAGGPVAVLITGASSGWPVEYVSANIVSLIGYSAEELMSPGFSYESLIHRDDLKALLADTVEKLARKTAFFESSYRLRQRDGSYRWFYEFTLPGYAPNGACLNIRSYLFDQTKLKEAQNDLRQRDAQVTAISMHVPGMLYEFKRSPGGGSCFPYASEGIRSIFALSPEDVRTDAAPFFARIHPEDRARLDDCISTAFLNRKDFEADFRVLHPQHGIRWVHGSSSPRILVDGNYVWDGYFFDITDRKLSEDETLRQGKRDAIERLAGGVAHDFNNYLASISLSAELIQSLPDVPSSVLELTNNLVGEIKAATHVARQLLAFTKDQPMHNEPILLDAFLRETASFALRGSAVSAVIEVPDLGLTISSDPNLLQQILFNLLINARQAMKEKGSVFLTVSTPHSDQIQLCIRDTGPGISKNLGDRIFEPYVTTKSAGSGLGLHVVHSLVERLNGQIKLETNSYEGAVFLITLPKSLDIGLSPQKTLNTDAPKGTGRAINRVLLLEDDAVQTHLLTEFFNRIGMEMFSFKTGDALLSAAPNHRSQGVRLVCLLDITIKDGEGGLEITPALRKLLPEARIFLMSGYSEAWQDRADSMTPFGVGFIAKPYTLADLRRMILADHLPLID